MDKYEEIFKASLIKTLHDAHIDLFDLAQIRVQQMVATVARLLLDEKEAFDVVISGGDSGLITTNICSQTYKQLKQPLPTVINLPIQRYKNEQLERYYHDDLNKYVPKILKLKQVLFIDDEIMIGWTAKTCIEALLAKNPVNNLKCIIVAENHFFEWHFDKPEIFIRLFSHARVIPGINQIFAYLISDEEYSYIQTITADIKDRQQAVALLISGKYKKFENNSSYFENSTEESLGNNKKYHDIKIKLNNKISALVSQGINKYKNKEIRFKF